MLEEFKRSYSHNTPTLVRWDCSLGLCSYSEYETSDCKCHKQSRDQLHFLENRNRTFCNYPWCHHPENCSHDCLSCLNPLVSLSLIILLLILAPFLDLFHSLFLTPSLLFLVHQLLLSFSLSPPAPSSLLHIPFSSFPFFFASCFLISLFLFLHLPLTPWESPTPPTARCIWCYYYVWNISFHLHEHGSAIPFCSKPMPPLNVWPCGQVEMQVMVQPCCLLGEIYQPLHEGSTWAHCLACMLEGTDKG